MQIELEAGNRLRVCVLNLQLVLSFFDTFSVLISYLSLALNFLKKQKMSF